MERGPHLRRESEAGRRKLLFTTDYSDLVNDFAFALVQEKRTHEPIGDALGRLTGEELRNSSDAVADEIVQEFPRFALTQCFLSRNSANSTPRRRRQRHFTSLVVSLVSAQEGLEVDCYGQEV